LDDVDNAGDSGDSEIEVAFSTTMDDSTFTTGNINVYVDEQKVDDGLLSFVHASDSRLIIDGFSRNVDPSDSMTVEFAADGVRDGLGNALFDEDTNKTVTVTSRTINPADGDGSDTGVDEVPFAGEIVAFQVGASNSEKVDDFEINTEAGAFVFSGDTGTNSETYVFDTAERNLSATYQLEDLASISPEKDSFGNHFGLGLRDLGLEASLAEDTADDIKDDEIAEVNISTLRGNEDVKVELIDSDGDEDESTTISLDGSGEATATFDADALDLDTGTYTVDVTDQDTGITLTTDSFEVGEAADIDASFTQSVFSNERGDVIEFTVDLTNTDTATVNIGEEAGQSGIGYGATFEVVDADDGEDDDDGQVTVQLNTHDTTDSPSPVVAADDGDEVNGYSDPTAVADDVLDVGAYDINVSASGSEDDVATLNLNELSADSFSLYTAPEVDAIQDAEEISEIETFKQGGNFTESSRIAFGDYLYHEVKASGLGGTFTSAAGSDDAEALMKVLTDEQFALNLSIVETDKTKSANSPAKELIDTKDAGSGSGADELDSLSDEFSNDEFHVIADGANDTYYIGFQINAGEDTSQTALEDDDEFEVTLQITDSQATRGLVDENVTLTQTFTVEDRDVQLDSTTEDADGNDVIEVEAASGGTITGTSSLAPGTEIDVRARATGETPFLFSQTVETASDRTFEADFDFSDQPVGLEFEVTADGPTNADGSDETLDAVIVESTASETPEPTEAPEETEPPEETAEPTATATEEPEATETPGQPGFGVIVALLAFMAAALLAIRRD
jgi:PGF-CTERM protein